MKLFNTLSAVAVVSAQFNDFANLNDLFASLQADLGAVTVTNNANEAAATEDVADGARYLITTTTTPTPAPPGPTTTPAPTGNGCWKCDAMSYAQCAGQGSFEICASDPDTTTGRDAVCFLELRESNNRLRQLCTGCKSRNACDTLKLQNFIGSAGSSRGGRFADQCKSEWFIQEVGRRYGSNQSTCRTCFLMCDGTTNEQECFGGMNQASTTAVQFKYPDFGTTTLGHYNSGTTRLNRTPNSGAVTAIQQSAVNNGQTVFSLGIPTGVRSIDTAEVNDPATAIPNQLMWGSTTAAGTGKEFTTATRGAGNDQSTMYLYWAIQDAPQAFWDMDLITVARKIRDSTLMASLTGTTYGAKLATQGINFY